ncbi:hypothetical protein LTR50_003884 [Elasticomyces elasticus]|nr:hypothetical protein LTR50_003884 [Elasticomyces elasticus]
MLTWLHGSASQPPAFLAYRSSNWFIVGTVSVAVFTDIFVYGLVVPVLPFTLTSRSGIHPSSVQSWVSILLAVYGAALLAASPFCGWLADRTSSRRFPLLLGLFALAGSTVMLTVGNSIAILVAGRVFQGISAAVVWCVGLALLVDTVGKDNIGECMGWVGLSMSLAVLIAPLLGGVVFARAGYYAVFAMAFGLIGVDVMLRLALIEKKIAVKWQTPPEKDIPIRQHVPTETTAEKQIADGTPDAVTESTTSTPYVSPFAIRRLPPVITLLASRRLLAALWGCLIQAALLTSFDSVLPLFVRDTFGWDSVGAGLIFLPVVLPSFVGPLVGWLADKYGPRWLTTVGFVAAAPCLILLRLVSHNSLGQKAGLCTLLFLIGMTLNLVLTPLMAEVTYAVEAKEKKHPDRSFGPYGAYAQAYGLFNMAFAGGCLVGPLVGGFINQKAGWGATTLALGILSLFSALPSVVWSGGSIFKKRRKDKEESEAERA